MEISEFGPLAAKAKGGDACSKSKQGNPDAKSPRSNKNKSGSQLEDVEETKLPSNVIESPAVLRQCADYARSAVKTPLVRTSPYLEGVDSNAGTTRPSGNRILISTANLIREYNGRYFAMSEGDMLRANRQYVESISYCAFAEQ